MSGNAQKTPFLDSFVRNVEGGAQSLQETLGRAPPASIMEMVGDTGTIVKVKVELESPFTFPPITCPVVGPEFLRFPLKAGVKGYLLPSDYYLGGMSGLGGGTARLTRQGNLSSLVFFPIGNSGNSPMEDPEKTELYGDTGVILKSKDGGVKLIIDKDTGLRLLLDGVELMTLNSGGLSLMFQGKGIFIDENGTNVDGVNFLPHQHTGVDIGPSNTGPVDP